MSHSFHEALDGFDPAQILVDGCPECEDRGRNLPVALAHIDDQRFAAAWKRAYDLYALDSPSVGRVSDAEKPLLEVLWGIQCVLQRFGVPLNGTPPQRTVATAVLLPAIRIAEATTCECGCCMYLRQAHQQLERVANVCPPREAA